MKKILSFTILLITFVSCISEDVVLQDSPHIKKFAFGSHTAVPGIEKIAFTVDTVQCIIYNEDSIAYGADLKKMMPYITYTGSPKKIQVNGTDWNKTDSIDFSRPVKYYIQSQNKKNEATYTITLRQHQVNPDQLFWSEQKSLSLPYPTTQIRCISTQQALWMFTAPTAPHNLGLIYQLNSQNNWTQMGEFETSLLTNSIDVFQQQIYAISADSTTLLRLNQTTWEEVASFSSGKMADILGSIQQKMYIRYLSQGQSWLASYDGTTLQPETQAVLPPHFGMDGYSKLTANNTLYLIGGMHQNQETNHVISSDNGLYWTDILNQSGSYTFTPRCQASTAYYGKFIFAIGGTYKQKPVLQHYLSNNGGYSWSELAAFQQLPDNYRYTIGTQATSFNNNLWLIGLTEDGHRITVWKGRINKIDFIKQ